MAAKIYDGIEVRAQQALDTRTIVTYKTDLIKKSSFPHDGDTIYMKEGMTVTVTGTKEDPVFDLYILTDLDKILATDYSGWKLVNGGGFGNVNLDGGRAEEIYTPQQIIDAGSQNGATARGEELVE